MVFSDVEILLAKRLRELGLTWVPTVGHYVFDETGFCRKPSPFQDRVYFVLNYDYFVQAVGGVDRFKEIMIWLPTWEDLRVALRNRGVSDLEIAAHLTKQRAIESGAERRVLYELLTVLLEQYAAPPSIPVD